MSVLENSARSARCGRRTSFIGRASGCGPECADRFEADASHADRPAAALAARARRRVAIAALGLAAACGDTATTPDMTGAGPLRTLALEAGLLPLPPGPVRPIDNPFLAERVDLGHRLFFDPILSGPRDVACSTCHLPRFGFADGRQFPSGAGGFGLGPDRTDPQPAPLRPMPRNSPTIFNLGAYGRFGVAASTNAMMFWSGGAFGIEDQVLLPITADNELRGLAYPKVVAIDSVLGRLRRIPEYVARFESAFPELAAVPGSGAERLVKSQTLRLALAAYVRELVTPRSPLDDFLLGDDGALSNAQRQGLALFIGAAGCVQCHRGPVLSDFQLHITGVRQMGLGRDTTPGDDLGWGEHGGTPYSFRTAPLRQVALTAPYFHAGTAATLAAVIQFKGEGRSEHPKVPNGDLDPAVQPLSLAEPEVNAIIAFLHALTDTLSVKAPLFDAPASVPSGLPIPREEP